MSVIVGIDIGKDQLEVVLLRPDHDPEQADFANSTTGFKQLWRFLRRRQAKDGHACMEATGLYYELVADFLHEKGMTVSVVNPARISAYASSQMRRNKTDRLDAAVIADFCRTQQPSVWTPPEPAWRHLRALARHLYDLQTDLQRQRNRLHARQRAADPVAPVVQNLEQQIALLEQQIDQIKRDMNAHVSRYPHLKRERDLIASIPGIGDLTANKLLAEFRDITAFDGVRQLVAFAGLNPKHYQSGTSIQRPTRISKMGAPSIRAALYMPAVTAKSCNPIMQRLAERLEARGKCKMEIVVAIMRKLLHLIYGILKSGQPFDPDFLDKKAASA